LNVLVQELHFGAAFVLIEGVWILAYIQGQRKALLIYWETVMMYGLEVALRRDDG
jgi:hypothetical protein